MFKVKYFRHSEKSNFNQVIGEQVINFNQFKKNMNYICTYNLTFFLNEQKNG